MGCVARISPPLRLLGNFQREWRLLAFQRGEKPAIERRVLARLQHGHRIERIANPIGRRRIGQQRRYKTPRATRGDAARLSYISFVREI